MSKQSDPSVRVTHVTNGEVADCATHRAASYRQVGEMCAGIFKMIAQFAVGMRNRGL